MTAKPAVSFSRHARNRVRRARLTEADVIAVVEQPSHVTPSFKGRQNAWKRRGMEWLRATYVVEQTTTAIITVTPRGPERRRR